MSNQYCYSTTKGFSKPTSISKVMAVAAKRIVAGRGPFSMSEETGGTSDVIFTDKSRRVALKRLRRRLEVDKAQTTVRIRGAKRVVIGVKVVEDKESQVRGEVVKWARWASAHRGSIHYSESRPIPRYAPGHLPMTLDCSGSIITYCHWADAPDPSGEGYNGAGSSYTIDSHLPTIHQSEARPGDIILFTSPNHVALVVEMGSDPLLVSHGSEIGPLTVRLSVERRYHGWYHFLRLM